MQRLPPTCRGSYRSDEPSRDSRVPPRNARCKLSTRRHFEIAALQCTISRVYIELLQFRRQIPLERQKKIPDRPSEKASENFSSRRKKKNFLGKLPGDHREPTRRSQGTHPAIARKPPDDAPATRMQFSPTKRSSSGARSDCCHC